MICRANGVTLTVYLLLHKVSTETQSKQKRYFCCMWLLGVTAVAEAIIMNTFLCILLQPLCITCCTAGYFLIIPPVCGTIILPVFPIFRLNDRFPRVQGMTVNKLCLNMTSNNVHDDLKLILLGYSTALIIPWSVTVK